MVETVRVASMDRLTTRPREVFGSELKDNSWILCDEDPEAGRIEDQLGPPKTPWMVWMRWDEIVRAMVAVCITREGR